MREGKARWLAVDERVSSGGGRGWLGSGARRRGRLDEFLAARLVVFVRAVVHLRRESRRGRCERALVVGLTRNVGTPKFDEPNSKVAKLLKTKNSAALQDGWSDYYCRKN